MKSRPILFNDDMVRAVLAGRKTVTRRPFKRPSWVSEHDEPDLIAALNRYGGQTSMRGPCDGSKTYVCPLGVPGDELWMREAWRIGSWKPDPNRFGDLVALDYRATNGERSPWINPTYGADGPVDYKADEQRARLLRDAIKRTKAAHAKGMVPYDAATDKYIWEPGKAPLPWIPSFLQPRWASRLTLSVTSVRVERVQDIEEDAWSAIYPATPWDMNPWVWAVGFEVRR